MDNNTKTIGDGFLAAVGIFILLALLWLYGIFAYGFVATKLWVWFVVPVFHTDITLGILQASGLYMLVRFFTQEYKMPVTDPNETVEKQISKVFIPIIVPWATLVFAWMLKSLM